MKRLVSWSFDLLQVGNVRRDVDRTTTSDARISLAAGCRTDADSAGFGRRAPKSFENELGLSFAVAVRMGAANEDIEALSGKVIGCAIEVHRSLGPGLLESVYRECMLLELRAARLCVASNGRVVLSYKDHTIGCPLRLDLLVEGCLVVELKAVERLHPLHLAQVITYLKLTGYPAGLLLNFNATSLRAGLRRLDHPDRYRRRSG